MEPQELRIAIDVLRYFQTKAYRQFFMESFGANLGEHLYQKYSVDYKYSILKLWAYLDNGNREKLVRIMSSMTDEVPF